MEIVLKQAKGEIPLTVDQIWAKYDKDGNGTLSKAECRNYVQDMLALRGENPKISDTEYNALFALYDKDGNGVVSKDEMAIVLKQAQGEIPLTVEQIWAKYDKDGNGTLSKAECRNYVQDMLAHRGENP